MHPLPILSLLNRMFIPNNIFVDSSVLIEYRKGSKTELLEHLFEQDYQPFIGHPVISEFLYHNLSIFSGKSPLTIKSNGEIGKIIDKSNSNEFLSLFGYLTDYENLQNDVIEIMSKYNLLPNDSAINALCVHHQIFKIASFDADFKNACKDKGILLISEVTQL